MTPEIVDAAYRGAWPDLLRLVQDQPHLINERSRKGYTPLHQAAWHGADRWVVGTLLALGADSAALTDERAQSAADIALENHPTRDDLQYLLDAQGRTLGQLLRKFVADTPKLFGQYDGNQVLCDRVLDGLGAGDQESTDADPSQALLTALHVAAGPAFVTTGSTSVDGMEASSALWLDTIIPAVAQMSSRAHVIALEPSYTAMSDLFTPQPAQWGLRGDPFLWVEMRQALCHVPVPANDHTVRHILFGSFSALTGEQLSKGKNLAIKRFARGGMSSGMICGETWADRLLPLLCARAQWLRDAWERPSGVISTGKD